MSMSEGKRKSDGREEKRERKLEERRERERLRKAERASVASFGLGMSSMGGLSDVQAMGQRVLYQRVDVRS